MDKTQQKILEDKLKTEFEKVRNSGLISGSKAICAVVLEKANDTSKTESERILDIIDFCKVSLGVQDNA